MKIILRKKQKIKLHQMKMKIKVRIKKKKKRTIIMMKFEKKTFLIKRKSMLKIILFIISQKFLQKKEKTH